MMRIEIVEILFVQYFLISYLYHNPDTVFLALLLDKQL